MNTIKIPKLGVGDDVVVKVYAGKTAERFGHRLFYLRRQEIAGVEFPKDFEIRVDVGQFGINYGGDEVTVGGIVLNKYLRHLYLEGLRESLRKN